MYLIADSGNSECKWSMVDSNGYVLLEFTTSGINPYYHSTERIKAKLWEVDSALLIKGRVTEVFFYGAGCSSEELKDVVREALAKFFTNADIVVEHDLVSAAYATYSGKPVISCILGTGSNSTFFDGEQISEVIPNLAYILGDEGSGCYFGKMLIRDFYYGLLPGPISRAFSSETRMTAKELNERVYSQPGANVFLASFMPFLSKFKFHHYVKGLMIEGFRKFIKYQVKCFPNWADVEVSFTGSVAVNFEEHLEAACFLEGVTFGRVVSDPMKHIIDFHINSMSTESVFR